MNMQTFKVTMFFTFVTIYYPLDDTFNLVRRDQADLIF